MATKKKGRRTRKRKGKIKVTQKAQLRQKSDTTALDTIHGRLPADAGINFKVKLKRKRH